MVEVPLAARLPSETEIPSVTLPFALAAAWVLARCKFPGRTLLDALVHAPLVLPPVVVGYGLLLLFGARGPLGEWLGLRLAFSTSGAVLAAAVIWLTHRPGFNFTRVAAIGAVEYEAALAGASHVSLMGRLEINRWNGRETCQLKVLDAALD